jgi:hypothetical protein
MRLDEYARIVNGMDQMAHAERIKHFAWFLHTYRRHEHFMPVDIKKCYDDLHLDPPNTMGPYFKRLSEGKDKILLHNSQGYRLTKVVRDKFDILYGQRQSAVNLDQLLANLPTKVSDLDERTYLEEGLLCFRHRAYRASVVMVWNLAYHRFRRYILDNKKIEFDGSITAVCGARPKINSVNRIEDFEEFQERQVLEIARNAKITSPSTHKVLTSALDKRNNAAHPALVTIDHIQAEAFIADVVQNVVLRYI